MEKYFDDVLKQEIVERMRTRMQGDRSEGVHLSDLLLCLNRPYFKKDVEEQLTDQQVLLFSMGRAIQDWLTGVADDADEVQIDGVWMTPDYVQSTNPWECKLTYMSDNKDTPEHWLRQMKSYCKALGVNTFSCVRLGIMGDWSWVYKRKGVVANDEHPVLTPLTYTFTDEELEENWDWVVRRREMLEMAIDAETPPSLLFADYMGLEDAKWRCKNCGVAVICPATLKV